ncbi:MAG TPA: DNA repair protein RadA, partial [Candidatus Desulfofervidus auxilii]|nr:DNA repair protein RadA [Candidatus Desulfofervidus auxilii]
MSMKKQTQFICQKCGYCSPKWLGKCPDCGSWNTFVEETISEKEFSVPQTSVEPISITEVNTVKLFRLKTGLSEFDRVLGGGLVPGAVILIGGAPGIGKSTLALQILANLAKEGLITLYVSGEESASQIKLRAERLNINYSYLYLLTENSLEHILKAIKKIEAKILVIDSIQTMFSHNLTSAPGSVSQIREVTGHLVRLAKSDEITIIIIGHVTKEGAIAGPRLLEHMVDTVLYFEG